MLILDTVTGSAAASLYESLGWVTVGTIPLMRWTLMAYRRRRRTTTRTSGERVGGSPADPDRA